MGLSLHFCAPNTIFDLCEESRLQVPSQDHNGKSAQPDGVIHGKQVSLLNICELYF